MPVWNFLNIPFILWQLLLNFFININDCSSYTLFILHHSTDVCQQVHLLLLFAWFLSFFPFFFLFYFCHQRRKDSIQICLLTLYCGVYLYSRVVFLLLGESFSQKKLKINPFSANPVLVLRWWVSQHCFLSQFYWYNCSSEMPGHCSFIVTVAVFSPCVILLSLVPWLCAYRPLYCC